LASQGIEVGFVNYMAPARSSAWRFSPGTGACAHACAYETSLATRAAAGGSQCDGRENRAVAAACRAVLRRRNAPDPNFARPAPISPRSSRPAMSVT